MTISLITLDLDHTLWNPNTALQRAEIASHAWLAKAAPSFGNKFPLPAFVDWRMALCEQQPAMKHRVSEIRRQSFITALEHTGHNTQEASALAAQAFQVFWELRQEVALFDDTQWLLEVLSRDYTLGAISNGNACLKTIGLAPFFAFHFAADDFPTAKPAADLFLAALAHTGVAASNTVHIGDHPVDDIQGAKAVGMKTVWVNLDDHSWPVDLVPADVEVNNLLAIPAAIQTLTML
jgi:putative hydrolase of the HAD superfamily